MWTKDVKAVDTRWTSITTHSNEKKKKNERNVFFHIDSTGAVSVKFISEPHLKHCANINCYPGWSLKTLYLMMSLQGFLEEGISKDVC